MVLIFASHTPLCSAVIRRKEETGTAPFPTVRLLYACYKAVSRKKPQAKEPTRLKDDSKWPEHRQEELRELRASFDAMKKELGPGFQWPHRGRLSRALEYEANLYMTNIKVDIKTNLAMRMQRWLVLRLSPVAEQDGVTEDQLWNIAGRLVSTLVWDEKKAVAQALRDGHPSPPPPTYARKSISELFDQETLGNLKLLSLKSATKTAISDLVEIMEDRIGVSALPLCPSNFEMKNNDER